ncbi:YqaI family protein [Planococcus dechangensis]|uniref:YqaI-like protein n=1 Tax=Planococcus dechangensis TaxID=1176255 RepID=A0ABV9M8U3_9BACL
MHHPDVERCMLTGYPVTDSRFESSEISIEVENDHPIEDHFGSEIQSGDTWFEDKAGRVVLQDNMEDYLIEVVGAEFFKALK